MVSFRYVTRLDHEHHMRQALTAARRARREGEQPVAAVLVDPEGQPVATTVDTVARDADPTSHAALALVRQACRLRGRDLAGYTVYCTIEPCPMCFTAIWLAGVSRVVYGVTLAEVRERSGPAMRELWMPCELVNEFAPSKINIVGGVLADECLALFEPVADPALAAAPEPLSAPRLPL